MNFKYIINFITYCLAACLICVNTSLDKLSFNIVTTPILTITIIAYLTSLVPIFKKTIYIVVGTVVFVSCFIDSFCQSFFQTHISPQIIFNIFHTEWQETKDFFSAFVNFHIFLKPRVTAIIIFYLLYVFSILDILPIFPLQKYTWGKKTYKSLKTSFILLVFILLVYELPHSINYCKLLGNKNITHIETLIFNGYHEEMPTPIHRTLYSILACNISSQNVIEMRNATLSAKIDSCSYRSQHIVLIIGESYNKHHSSLYGYEKMTTPRQLSRMKAGELFVFDDVITPSNITSNVFLNIFSTWHNGSTFKIQDCPMFPYIFRKAGYKTAFFTNQYASKGLIRGATTQSGSFFLTDRILSNTMFNTRNKKAYKYDEMLIREFEQYKKQCDNQKYTMDIIHLRGQHFDYSERYPKEYAEFSLYDYKRRNILEKDKEILMNYDNSCFYNDYILDEIITLYQNDDAILIFVADHGEEVFDNEPIHGRCFNTPNAAIAKNEYEVPMWIWCSNSYKEKHRDITKLIKSSTHKPFITDKIPALLFYISGIYSKYFSEEDCVISPKYKTNDRYIYGNVNYDSLNIQ
ncbi:MAG: phosphoethanolamine transferase [Lachnospiraceae bacterium]